MTKKDYELIARAMKAELGDYDNMSEGYRAILKIVEILITIFKENNERFNAIKFLTACGLSKDEI